jgi:cysteine desulfurase
VADLLGADPREIIFTSGGTESINLAVRGMLAQRSDKKRVVTSTVEHSAVRNLCHQLAREGYTIDEIGVDAEGRLDLSQLEQSVNDDVALLSVMWANNETGVLFDVYAAAQLASERGVPLHLDAVQAAGKVSIDVADLPVHLLSVSAHKFHGPKGAGALFVRKRTRIKPQLIGGRQERDLRAGTENVAAIVGMGVAAEVAARVTAAERDRVAALRDRLEQGICMRVDRAAVNGAGAPRIANTTNIGFRDLAAEALLILLGESGVCVSSGSACSSGSLEPSHVLAAMNVDPRYAHGAIRFSLSRITTDKEIDRVLEIIPQVVARLAGVATA